MSKTRRSFDPEFKLQLILEVLQGKRITDVAKKHDIHHTLLTKWKSDFLNAGQSAFVSNSKADSKKDIKIKKLEKESDQMKKIIGEQRVQIEILKKKSWLD